MTISEIASTLSLTPDDDNRSYTALRNQCVIFDGSDARFIRVAGPDAEDLLQHTLSRDIEYLPPEHGGTAMMLDHDGSLLDVIHLLRLDDTYLVQVTADVAEGIRLHLESECQSQSLNASIEVEPDLTCVAIEGPYAWHEAGRIVADELAALPLDSVVDAQWNGFDLIFCRSGSTGEYGYRFIGSHEAITAVSATLNEELPVASGAVLKMAQLEVRHPAVEPRDDVRTIIQSGCAWLIDSTKEAFVGFDALRSVHDAATTVTVAFTADGTDAIDGGTSITTADGSVLGTVHSSLFSIGLDKVLGLAVLDREVACVGLELLAGGRELHTVSSPLIVPLSWKTPIL